MSFHADQYGQLVPLCWWCGDFRATDGMYCAECADLLNESRPAARLFPSGDRGGLADRVETLPPSVSPAAADLNEGDD